MRNESLRGSRTILMAGLLAGVLDLAAALTMHALRGIEPLRILQSIASGVLGADAYAGGGWTAALGTVLHFAIMLVIAAIYVIASRRMEFLRVHPWISGTVFGVAVHFVMTGVVLPLSAFPHPVSFQLAQIWSAVVIQILFVGLPISLLVAHSDKRRNTRVIKAMANA